MLWSLRDEKQMEELGFPKSAKCQRYYQMCGSFSTTSSNLTTSNNTSARNNPNTSSVPNDLP